MSAIVSVTSAGAFTPVPDTAPETITVLSAAYAALSTPVIVTMPVLEVALAAKLRTLFALRLKSAATAGATGVAYTVTVNAVAEAGDTVAVTVPISPSSPIESSDSARVTCCCVVGVPAVPLTVMSNAAAVEPQVPVSEFL